MDYPKKGRYRHFKGGEYELLYFARHSENDEVMVVYKALYDCGETPLNERIWVRPLSMWTETVTRDGKTFPRFSYVVEEPELPPPPEEAPPETFTDGFEGLPLPENEIPALRGNPPVSSDIHKILSDVYGYAEFRRGQEDIITRVTAGQQVLGVMPTGAGKSLCYQIPALALPGTAIVISPLISLMKDQVNALCQAGVSAAFINSSLTEKQVSAALRNALNGSYKIIYVAPERLLTERFLYLASHIEISLVAVDEAHCISQWGQDFRPAYLDIPEFISRLPVKPRLCAFTATATEKVRADIKKLLGLVKPYEIVTGFDRPNLYFRVIRPENKLNALFDLMTTYANMSGIVYCSTRKLVEEVTDALNARGIEATRYHAGLSEEERKANQDAFSADEKPIIVATNAFGMGIDKSNVRFVIHYNMPKDIESYYQEAGRAGRDGERSDCVLMYSPQDVVTQSYFIDHMGEEAELEPKQVEELKRAARMRLSRMKAYAQSGSCLRNALLAYFGETAKDNCGHCSVCDGFMTRTDMTACAEKVLELVSSLRYPLGAGGLTLILRGARTEQILSRHLDTLPMYGCLSNLDKSTVSELIDMMLGQDILKRTEGEYPVILSGPAAAELRSGRKRVTMMREPARPKKTAAEKKTSAEKKGTSAASVVSISGKEAGLFFRLRQCRKALAEKSGVPPFMIFSDATLTDMTRRRPHSEGEFLEVSGVGAHKCQKYAAPFIETIRAWEEENE